MSARRDLTQHREAVRQLSSGIDGNELCIPCKNAIFDDDFARIGTKAWLNDGYPDCKHLDKPALYCCFCRHVLRAKELARRKGHAEQPSQNIVLDWVLIGMEQGIFIHDDGSDLDDDAEKNLEGFEVEKCGFVRSIRHRWADMDRIKRWLDDCENGHGETCNGHRESAGEDSGKLVLVDVLEDCLVQGTFEDRYFALSYVWGQSKQFLTLKENYDQLLLPGSLSKQPTTQTIKDAMTFVKELGERYVWVDTVVSRARSLMFHFMYAYYPIHSVSFKMTCRIKPLQSLRCRRFIAALSPPSLQ